MNNSSSIQNRLSFIESLRGVAALSVLMYHLAYIPRPNLDAPVWMWKLVLVGGSGVTLFFVVSAFTLTMSMRLRSQEPQQLLGFYVRRFFRIVPLFYFWVALTWLRDRAWFGVTQSLGTVILSMSFLFNLFPGKETGFVWASWTLGVEMLFYFFFPLIYYFVDDIWKSLGFFFLSLVVSSVFSYLAKSYLHLDDSIVSSFIDISFFHHLPAFAFGIFIYYAYERYIQNQSISISWGVLILSIGLYGYSAMQDGRLGAFFEIKHWQAVIYGALVVGLSILPLGILVNRITSFYGEISYSVYLNHPSLVFALIPVYRYVYEMPIPLTVKYSLCFLLTLVLLTIASYFTYHAVEKPGMRLGSWVLKKLRGMQLFASAES